MGELQGEEEVVTCKRLVWAALGGVCLHVFILAMKVRNRQVCVFGVGELYCVLREVRLMVSGEWKCVSQAHWQHVHSGCQTP